MDYGLTPTGADASTAIAVPFVATDDYEFDPQSNDYTFLTFGTSIGFLDDEGRMADIEQDEVAAIVQSWFYFGLLSTFLGHRIGQADFQVQHQRTVDSARVMATIEALVRQRHANLAVQYTHLDNVRRFGRAIGRATGLPFAYRSGLPDTLHLSPLEHLNFVLARITLIEDAYPDLDKTGLAPVLLSVKTSLDILDRVNPSIWDGGTRLSFFGPKWDRKSDSMLRDLFIQSEWCPHQASRAMARNSYAIVYFLSRIPRTLRDHTKCERKCVAWNAAEGFNDRQHRFDCASCEVLEVSTENISSIINKGGVPLIGLEKDGRNGWKLKVKSRSSRSSYIAISHVWAGGLGNAYINGLPKCQILHLFQQLGRGVVKGPPSRRLWRSLATKKPILLWMDTLCIPPEKYRPALPDRDKVKMKAIASMNGIYAEAFATLVLDPELQHIDSSPVTTAEHFNITSRIIVGGWGTRAWVVNSIIHYGYLENNSLLYYGSSYVFKTFQEEVLSRQICFALRDSVYWPNTSPKSQIQLTGSIWRQKSDSAHKYTFLTAWNEIYGRTTSKNADLSAIIANILRLSSYQLSRVPKEKRLSALILAQPRLPLGILFGLENTRADRVYDMDEVRALLKKSMPNVGHKASRKSTVAVPDVEMAVLEPPAQGQIDSAAQESYKLNSWMPSAISSELSGKELWNINGRLYVERMAGARGLIILPCRCANDLKFRVQTQFLGKMIHLGLRRDAPAQATQVDGEKKLCLLFKPQALGGLYRTYLGDLYPRQTHCKGAELTLVDQCKVPATSIPGTWIPATLNPFRHDDFRLILPASKRTAADWPLLTTVYRGAVDVHLLDECDSEEFAQTLYEGEWDTESILSIVYDADDIGSVLSPAFEYRSESKISFVMVYCCFFSLVALCFFSSVRIVLSTRRKDVGMWFLVVAPLVQVFLFENLLNRVLDMARQKRFLLGINEREPHQSCVRRWALAFKIGLVQFIAGCWMRPMLWLFSLIAWMAFWLQLRKQDFLHLSKD